MIDLVDHQTLRRGILQNGFTEGVKRRERDIFAAFAGSAHDASFHFTGGPVRKRQSENIFAGKRLVSLKQMANALRNNASLTRARARNDEQWPIAVSDSTPLRFV